MKLLVLCDDIWHPAEVVKMGLAHLEKNHEVTYICDAKDILTVDMINQYDVIINAKGNNLTSGNEAPWFETGIAEVGAAELADFVKNGKGILSLHAGNSIQENVVPEYTDLIGCSFIGHPPRCEVRCEVLPVHPITCGISPSYTVWDEHYMLRIADPDGLTPLMNTYSEKGGKQIGAYIKTVGQGRIAMLAIGHVYSSLTKDETKMLISNMVKWLAEKSD